MYVDLFFFGFQIIFSIEYEFRIICLVYENCTIKGEGKQFA